MKTRWKDCDFEGILTILKSLDSSRYFIDSTLAIDKYRDEKWKLVLWLCKIANIELKTECKELMYNNFIYLEKRFNMDDYIKLLEETKQSSNLRINDISIELKIPNQFSHSFSNSREKLFKLNWASHRFQCGFGIPVDAHESLCDKAFPFFPSFYELIEKYTKINLERYNGFRNSFIIVIPIEKAKFSNFYQTSDSLVFGIQLSNYDLKDLCIKVYFESSLGAVNQEFKYGDLKQENNIIHFGDGLSKIGMILIDREGEILDEIDRIHELSQVESEPEIILKIIEEGETDKVEFKTEEYDTEKLSKDIMAFSNSNGGTILIGVDDEGEIVGIKKYSKDKIDKDIQNICHDKCIPSINVETNSIEIYNKKLVIIKVPQNKGIQYKKSGVFYIRKGSTCRIAHPHEVESLFKNEEGIFKNPYL